MNHWRFTNVTVGGGMFKITWDYEETYLLPTLTCSLLSDAESDFSAISLWVTVFYWPCFHCFLLIWRRGLPVSTGALCPERHLMESDEAWLLPRPRGLSGLLEVNSFPGLVSCCSINNQISRPALVRQIKAAKSCIDCGRALYIWIMALLSLSVLTRIMALIRGNYPNGVSVPECRRV